MNFSTITPGEPYSDAALNRYVRRLNASGYFASVQARIDAEAPNETPVFSKIDFKNPGAPTSTSSLPACSAS